MKSENINGLSRRSFLLGGLAAASASRAAILPLQQAALPETLAEWLSASPKIRELALQRCLDRIQKMEPSIHAWIQVSPEMNSTPGPLAGIPYGVKDIIETKGRATEYGSEIYKGRIGTSDAEIVREMREHGAILLGKTQTTAFAYMTPAPTRNPRDLDRTPGGSSSGSAAAVAAGMVPFTIGEQTRGSILRPASFCGITGFKPTHGLLSMEGVLLLSKSLDTLGFFTNTPADMSALWESLGYPTGRAEDFDFGAADPIPDVDPVMATAYKNAISRLRNAGASIKAIDIAGTLAKLADANLTVMLYEGARVHKERYEQYGDRLGDLAKMVRQGLQISAAEYEETLRFIESCRVEFAEQFKRTPVIVTPAAVGAAPAGLAATGDPRMNAPWTALGTPAISVPMPVGSALPLGLQITADRGDDSRLLRAAVRLQNMLGSEPV